jgi:purine nucleoside permease
MPSASTVATSSNVTVPFVVNVVLITAFPPELTRWISSLPLNEQLPFPQGNEPSGAPLRLNRSLGVLGITTGMGPMRAAASIVALGHDLRWDLSASYFLVAGIAGVDPQFGSIGSAFVARHLVGIGGGYFLDGVGHIPQGRTHVDFGPPLPTPVDSRAQGVLHSLSSELSAWALGLASTASLPDTPSLQAARARFTAPTEAPARLPPAVRAGDSVTGETFGAGFEWTAWARNATAYWGGGRASFASTQMEDLAFATALGSLTRDGRANVSRLVVLRAVSDYSYPPPGQVSIREWFFNDPLHMCNNEAFYALLAAGMPIVRGMIARATSDAASSPPNALTPSRGGAGCAPSAGPLAQARAAAAALDVSGQGGASRPSLYQSNADGLVIALPWWAVWFIVALAGGVIPFTLAIVACVVWRRRRKRASMMPLGPSATGVRPAAPVHLPHVQLREEEETPRSPSCRWPRQPKECTSTCEAEM